MGLALAAELNGYPGPMHVLENADGLALTPEQQQQTKALMQAHKEEAKAIGAKLAEIAVRLEVARAAIWQAAWASDHPDAVADRSLPDLPLTTVASVFAAEAIYRAVKDAAECFGAMGVMRDMPPHKYVHDARACLHSGVGVSEAKLRIAEALARYRRPAAPAAVLAAE